MGLVHLDIKPDNIFISSVRDAPGSYISDSNEEPMDTLEEGDTTPAQFLYKIGVWQQGSWWGKLLYRDR